MSKNRAFKGMGLLLLSTFLSAAFAQTQPVTIQEWMNHQAEKKRAEWANEVADAKRKSAGASPVQIARTCEEDLAMYNVYGLGNKLVADVGYRGAVIALSPGSEMDAGGWYMDELTPTKAKLSKRVRGKPTSICTVYLSGTTRPETTPVPSMTATPVPLPVLHRSAADTAVAAPTSSTVSR